MDKIWILILAVAIFLTINLLYSKFLRGYVRKNFGKHWLRVWGNKVYFWQSSIFVSTAGTAIVMYLLKWFQILTF